MTPSLQWGSLTLWGSMPIAVIFRNFPTMKDFSEKESYIVGKKLDLVKFRNFPTTKDHSCWKSYIVGKYVDCHDNRTLPHNEGFFQRMNPTLWGRNFDNDFLHCGEEFWLSKIQKVPHNEGSFMLKILHCGEAWQLAWSSDTSPQWRICNAINLTVISYIVGKPKLT